MLSAVLFDFDGLILDTETPEVEVLKEVFAEHGQVLPSEYWINAFGRGADQLEEKSMQLLQRLCGRNLDIESLEVERRRRTVERIEREPVRPGVLELIEQAHGASLPLGIASSSQHWWVDGHLKRLGLLSNFETIVCADDVARAKPFPDLYLTLIERMGLDSEQTFTLEDSPNGVAAAKEAGLFVFAIENPLSRNLDLSRADRILPSLAGVGLNDLISLRHAASN